MKWCWTQVRAAFSWARSCKFRAQRSSPTDSLLSLYSYAIERTMRSCLATLFTVYRFWCSSLDAELPFNSVREKGSRRLQNDCWSQLHQYCSVQIRNRRVLQRDKARFDLRIYPGWLWQGRVHLSHSKKRTQTSQVITMLSIQELPSVTVHCPVPARYFSYLQYRHSHYSVPSI